MTRRPGKARPCLPLITLFTLLLCASCSHTPRPNLTEIRADWTGPTTRNLAYPDFNSDVQAVCEPPIGWTPDPLKTSPNHVHQAWLSPTRDTAYGVIHFQMPLPVGESFAMQGFLTEMKRTEGQAILIEQHDDPNLPGVRFVAEGGKYRIRANMILGDCEGWVIYAGTFRAKPDNRPELDQALRAREQTRPGRIDASAQ